MNTDLNSGGAKYEKEKNFCQIHHVTYYYQMKWLVIIDLQVNIYFYIFKLLSLKDIQEVRPKKTKTKKTKILLSPHAYLLNY